MSEPLLVIADHRVMGEIRRDRRGELSFTYDDQWRAWDAAYPLSLSMPLLSTAHGHSKINPWLWGLLPDNEAVLSRWARRFQVSPSNAFALLREVGEDCAGAIQLVRPERVREILRGDGRTVEWLTEADVADRLRALRQDVSAWRAPEDAGQFSLAGAQAKTALLFDGRRWGLPSGAVPTTHILKPPIPGFDGHAENEHVCLALARELGLPAASSEVRSFQDEIAVVVTRYDRVRAGGGAIRRLHQEDLCQVLGLPPTMKYQSDGGPGCSELSAALREHSEAAYSDVPLFASAIMFNWLIGGTDAHAKNYSMLIGSQGASRLAPLYDVASIFPYNDRYKLKTLKLSAKIGGKYRVQDVRARHWARFAEEVKLPPDDVIAMGLRMAERLPDATKKVVDNAQTRGIDHPILTHLVEWFDTRARYCTHVLEGRPIGRHHMPLIGWAESGAGGR